MGIKWKDVKLGVSPLTQNIYIGKIKPMGGSDGLEVWTDKSEDKTNDVLRAVVEWFIYLKEYDDKSKFSLEANGKEYTVSFSVKDLGETNE
ncbi:MAG: hypothetical protein GX763_02620 [Clostridiaceae bacterium]|nr:hypothetical protein [Clostridiaceae bacterium]